MPSDLSLHTGAFELLEPIARGGMADVWRARHIRTERLAAVKVLRKDTADHTRFRQSFLTDAQSIARIAHPNVVQLYDTGDVTADVAALSQGKLTAGSPYLVMEYAPNGALAEGLLLRWASLRTTLRQVLAGLAHTHSRGMIHLDVKPGNILAWGRDPATWHLKLTDFGTARRFVERERADTERWHVVQGTPLYMSPEQFDTNWRRITPASDVYGVGVVAFELATGNPPFMGDSVLDILKQHLSAPRNIPELDAPSAFSGWLRKALDPSLQRRFATAGTALRALDTLQEPIRVTSLASWREADVRLPTPLIEDEKLRLLALRDPPLVGREREQDILWSALQRTLTTGRAHTVVLSGVSGAGKTRLASWLGERAAELGIARFVHARHDRIAADHLGLQGLLDQLLNVRDADASTVRDQIAEVLARDARSSEKAQTLSYRTAVLADYLRPRTGGYATVENQSGDVEAAHRRVIEVLAQKEPLVVLLDDAHWDLSSLRLAEELALNGQGPVLVLVTVRDEDLEDLPASRGALDKMFASRVERLELGPLDRRATSTLISELTNLDGPSQRLLVDRTDGNPLFAIALVQQLIDSGAITVRDGNARLVRSDGLDRVALDDVWLDRVERALREIASALVADVGFEDLREALEIGCALGSAINIAEWEDACAHLPENATNAVTAALALANLAERGDRLVVLRHPMVREAVSAASVARGTSLERHSCAARALSARVEATGNLSRENAVRVGRHYVEAEDNHEALRWLSIATSRDFSRPLTTIAFSLYPLFLSVVERVGEPNLTIDQQLDYLHLTAIVAQNDGASVSNLGDVLSRWSDLAHKHGHVVHFCLAQQVRAYEALFRGDIREGLRLAEFGLAVARAFPENPWLEVELLRVTAELQSCEDDPAIARVTLDRMFTVLPESEGFSGAVGLFCYGRLEMLEGNLDDAKRRFLRAIEITTHRGWEVLSNVFAISLGHLLIEQNTLHDAEGVLRASSEFFRSRGDTRISYALVGIADALTRQGRYTEAIATATEARESAATRCQHGQVAIAEVLLATANAHLGEWSEVDAHLDEYERAQSRLSLVDVWTRRHLRHAVRVFEETGALGRSPRVTRLTDLMNPVI